VWCCWFADELPCYEAPVDENHPAAAVAFLTLIMKRGSSSFFVVCYYEMTKNEEGRTLNKCHSDHLPYRK
jgi:hypothetical protein